MADAPPLTGIRVLDVTHNLAGPLTGMHLADLGAEVIKVERPAGDDWRRHEDIPGHPDRSRHYMQANRGKRAVCLDLTLPEGREIVATLVARADVLITNLRPGVPERLGIGWEECRRRNPRLIYCAISAFGEDGPRGGRRGFDLVMEALAGFMPPSWAGEDRPPQGSPIPIHDTALPLLACAAILAALFERERSGEGQRVDTTLLGTAAALNAHSLVRLEDVTEAPVPNFARAFYRAYRTSDGWIAVAAMAEWMARALCEEIDLPRLLDDPRFARRADRVAHGDELAELIGGRMRTRSTSEWDQALGARGIPAAPVRERDDLFEDPQMAAMELLEEVVDEEVGRVTMAAPAMRLSRSPARMPFPGRRQGADTHEVLEEIGLTSERIAELEASGVVRAD